jgi:hypothetical protein
MSQAAFFLPIRTQTPFSRQRSPAAERSLCRQIEGWSLHGIAMANVGVNVPLIKTTSMIPISD